MRVRYTPRAFADRQAIFSYLNQRNSDAARRFKIFLDHRIRQLGDFPRRNRIVAELSVHALWLGRYPYIVYYRVITDEVWIIHIRHASRQQWQGE